MSPRKAFSFAISGILEAKSEEALEKYVIATGSTVPILPLSFFLATVQFGWNP